MVDLILITRRKMNTNQPTPSAHTEHQSFDFWVSFTEATKIPATDPAHRGHLGSTSSVRLGLPRDAQGA